MLTKDPVGRLALRVAFAAATPLFLHAASRPDARMEVVVGERVLPIRAMVLGAGLGVGFGVSGARQALPGRLAEQLASRTGRGVEMVTRVRADASLGRFGELVDDATLWTQDLVVLCPSLTEMVHGGSPRWQAELFCTVQRLRSRMHSAARLVLLGMPLPQRDGMLERVGLRACEEVNRVMTGVARTTSSTSQVLAPPFDTLRPDGSSFDAAFYERCAARIADAVAIDLALPTVTR